MLSLQYLRSILLVTNPVAATLAFAVTWSGKPTLLNALGGFLMGSWVMNAAFLVHTAWTLRNNNGGWIRVSDQEDDSDNAYDDPVGRRWTFKGTSVIFKLFDVILIIPLLVVMIVGFISLRNAQAIAACTSTIVAIVVHMVCFFASFQWRLLRIYKIKLVIIRRDQDLVQTHRSARERQTSKESPMSTSDPDPEPTSISPRPYKGSPSSKPSTGSKQSEVNESVKLIEATEGDALIADHDY